MYVSGVGVMVLLLLVFRVNNMDNILRITSVKLHSSFAFGICHWICCQRSVFNSLSIPLDGKLELLPCSCMIPTDNDKHLKLNIDKIKELAVDYKEAARKL